MLFLETKKKFPGQYDEEKVEMCMQMHWIALVPFFLIFTGILIAIIVASIFWLSRIQNSSTLVFLVNSITISILIHLFFIRVINHILRTVVVTNNRLIEICYTTIFQRERKMVDIVNIQDMRITQGGILKRIFNYGEITLHNSAGDTIFTFRYVPKPLKIYNILNHIYRNRIKTKPSMKLQQKELPENL